MPQKELMSQTHKQVHYSIIKAIDHLSLNGIIDLSIRNQIVVHVEEMESSNQ